MPNRRNNLRGIPVVGAQRFSDPVQSVRQRAATQAMRSRVGGKDPNTIKAEVTSHITYAKHIRYYCECAIIQSTELRTDLEAMRNASKVVFLFHDET